MNVVDVFMWDFLAGTIALLGVALVVLGLYVAFENWKATLVILAAMVLISGIGRGLRYLQARAEQPQHTHAEEEK